MNLTSALRPVRWSWVVLLAMGVGIATPGVAAAERGELSDPVADVVDMRDEIVVPGRPFLDLGGLVARHTEERVVVLVGVTDLKKGKRGGFQILISDHRGEIYGSSLRFSSANMTGELSVGSDDGDIECPGARSHIRYTRNTIRVSIPRSCLSDPKSVRVSALLFGGARQRYFDVAGQDGHLEREPIAPFTAALAPGRASAS